MIAQTDGRVLCRLLAAWIHGGALEPTETVDFEALFELANRHRLSAASCAALEATGLMELSPQDTAERFRQSRAMAVRRTMLMDAEQSKVTASLEEMGIDHAPLKGAAINSLYPEFGTREFADVDILVDPTQMRTIRDCMRGSGYEVQSFGIGWHDSYRKPPIYHFEMHRALFADEGEGGVVATCAAYYEHVWDLLLKDGENRHGWHFSDDDHYVYLVAHAYKHYGGGGTGLRTLLDLWLYRHGKHGLDERAIEVALGELGLTDFERTCRSLSDKLLSWPQRSDELTQREAEMLAQFEGSGVYGSVEHAVWNRLQAIQRADGVSSSRAKLKFIMRKLFPSREWYRLNMPFAGNHPWAIPIFWVQRLFLKLFGSRGRTLRVLRVLRTPAGESDASNGPSESQ